MSTRRAFLTAAATAAAALAMTSASDLARAAEAAPAASERGGKLPGNPPAKPGQHYRPPHRFGLGGVAIGTAFAPLTSEQSDQVMQGAWQAGVRYFDTSPWYGLGLSERRMGHFIEDQ